VKINPLISICIPVYNAEAYIEEAIVSCLEQTYSNIEVICVNDGSTDESLRIMKTFGRDITVLDAGKIGVQLARNTAFKYSSGEYINFFDADNKLLPDKLSLQSELLIKNEADLVFAKRIVSKPNGGIEYPSALESPEGKDPFVYCLRNNSPGDRAAIDTDVALHRRSFVEKVGGFREGVIRSQDKDFVFRMTAAGSRLGYVDEYLTIYRDHNGPRISNIQKAYDFNVNFFVSLIDSIFDNDFSKLSASAKKELAEKLLYSAKYAFRNGEESSALKGFDKLVELGVPVGDGEGCAYRFVRKIIGYKKIEKLISVIIN